MRAFARMCGGRLHGRFLAAVVLMILGFAPRPAAAQTSGVFGFVLSTSGQPIAGAQIREVSGPNPGVNTVSGQDGSYVITGLSLGTHTFAASQNGFHTAQRTVQVLNGDT